MWRWLVKARCASLRLVLCLGLAVLGAACDDDDTGTSPTGGASSTTTTTTTTRPAATVVVEGVELIPARQVFFIDATTTVAGRIDVAISYTRSDSSILMWLTDRKCSFTLFDRDDCDYLVKSLEGPTPRTMSSEAGIAPGTYTLFVHNDSAHDERLTYRISVTPAAGSAGGLSVGTPARARPEE
jgi:hypothetical protein